MISVLRKKKYKNEECGRGRAKLPLRNSISLGELCAGKTIRDVDQSGISRVRRIRLRSEVRPARPIAAESDVIPNYDPPGESSIDPISFQNPISTECAISQVECAPEFDFASGADVAPKPTAPESKFGREYDGADLSPENPTPARLASGQMACAVRKYGKPRESPRSPFRRRAGRPDRSGT